MTIISLETRRGADAAWLLSGAVDDRVAGPDPLDLLLDPASSGATFPSLRDRVAFLRDSALRLFGLPTIGLPPPPPDGGDAADDPALAEEIVVGAARDAALETGASPLIAGLPALVGEALRGEGAPPRWRPDLPVRFVPAFVDAVSRRLREMSPAAESCAPGM